jgi:hypothetical protein
MANYRIYMLDGAGRVLTGSDVSCQSDEAAFAWARVTLGMDASAEIWCGARCVGRVSGTTMMPHAYPPKLRFMRADAWQLGGRDSPWYVNDNAGAQGADSLRQE